MLSILFFIAAAVLVSAIIYSTVVFTPENHYSFITMFGKYRKTLKSGLGFKIPFITRVDAVVFLGLQTQVVNLSLKTKDQVTVDLDLNIIYSISIDVLEAYKSVYNIENLNKTLRQVATNASIPVANGIELEDVYNAKEEITNAAKSALVLFFESDFGVVFKDVLSDEPKLPDEVEQQANAVVAAKRGKDAAQYNADRIRIEKIGEAEADGESVKIRMEMLGAAREGYAEKSALAVNKLLAVGASTQDALAFLSHIGDNDAIVTASRNPANTVIISQVNKLSPSDSKAEVAGILEALTHKK
jgi:regulator of protease activity HflC (stomatin/prohibitin superfamily)